MLAPRNEYHAEPMQDIPEKPWPLFDRWLNEALDSGDYKEPTAMCLATADAAGRPSSRMVLLKDCSADGLVFYTNYQSRKSDQLAENPHAAITLWWDRLYRQVRAEGMVEKISEADSDAYFATRPRASNLSAMASDQSRPIDSRASLEAAVAKLEEEYEGQDVPRPPHWGGYRLIPNRIEFWQGQPNRLHDRYDYLLENGKWRMQRIQP